MKDKLTLFEFPVHRQPAGLQQLLQFGHFMLHQTKIVIQEDEEGQEFVNDCHFAFSPQYRGGLDVMYPHWQTPADKAIWTECLSALVQRIEASGTVIVVAARTCDEDLSGSVVPASERWEGVLMLAETPDGERGASRYRLLRGESGKLAVIDGEQLRPDQIQWNYMSDLFGRRGHSPRARRYTEQMLQRYPPTARPVH